MIDLQLWDQDGIMAHVYYPDKPEEYNVVNIDFDNMKYFCSCQDFYFRNRRCKHILEVEEYIEDEYERYMILSEGNINMVMMDE